LRFHWDLWRSFYISHKLITGCDSQLKASIVTCDYQKSLEPSNPLVYCRGILQLIRNTLEISCDLNEALVLPSSTWNREQDITGGEVACQTRYISGALSPTRSSEFNAFSDFCRLLTRFLSRISRCLIMSRIFQRWDLFHLSNRESTCQGCTEKSVMWFVAWQVNFARRFYTRAHVIL